MPKHVTKQFEKCTIAMKFQKEKQFPLWLLNWSFFLWPLNAEKSKQSYFPYDKTNQAIQTQFLILTIKTGFSSQTRYAEHTQASISQNWSYPQVKTAKLLFEN